MMQYDDLMAYSKYYVYIYSMMTSANEYVYTWHNLVMYIVNYNIGMKPYPGDCPTDYVTA